MEFPRCDDNTQSRRRHRRRLCINREADTPLTIIALAELDRRAGVPNAALTIVTIP